MTNTVDNSLNRLAYDFSGLNNLKRQASTTDGIKQVAQQFESVFVNMMMQSMRKATPTEGLFGSSGMQLFTSMFDQQISQQASAKGKGIGLAEILVKQMTPKTANANLLGQETNNAQSQNITPSQAVANSLLNQSKLSALSENISPNALGQMLYQSAKQKALNTNMLQPKAPVEKNANEPLADKVTNFIKEWLAPAKSVSQKSGIPYEVIIAQAALETGWGKNPITASNNLKQTYNYFGVKADPSWKGKTVDIFTKEFINGKETVLKDRFRSYDNPQHALDDYTKLLTQNGSRYQSIVNAADAHEAAYILQDNNYATDPNYANKLISLIERIRMAETEIASQTNGPDWNITANNNYSS